MTTSPTATLSKPVPGQPVPTDTLAYFRARAKRFAYDLVIRELNRSQISKAEIARRLGKDLGGVSRMLGGPGNWTIATISDLLFAVSGGVPTYGIDYPLDRPARNYSGASAVLDYGMQRDPQPAPASATDASTPTNLGTPALYAPIHVNAVTTLP